VYAVDSMRRFVKHLMRRYPTVFNPLWSLTYPWIIRRDEKYFGSEYTDRLEAFRTIYDENRWQSLESRSGYGSTVAYTHALRKSLAQYLTKLNVKIFLDAPCGDFNWMRHLADEIFSQTRYIGGDIIPELVHNLQDAYGGANRSFRIIDIVTGPLPSADLWLCRDILFHLPIEDIMKVLSNFTESTIPYLLTTTYDFPKRNVDVRAGGFRFINLRLQPFGLPRPLSRIPDFIAPEPPRYLGLWSRNQIASAICATQMIE
jgi:hypothetical protein